MIPEEELVNQHQAQDGVSLAVSVGEFVALCNQTLEFAYPSIVITGELANFRVSKNRWVYFDLKDDEACVRFFGAVHQLSGPLEDGMLLAVKGRPRLHPQYGFSVNIMTIQPVGEGSIKKAAALLQAKLEREGLFDPVRKRPLPYPPAHIGLITSGEAAAYRDFVKVLGERWGGMRITHIDVQVQGEAAAGQVVSAIEQYNQLAEPPEVLVITRGGGSAEDLQAFSTEQVTRAAAASRIPTLVAIGHETDTSLAELAADKRASTPSNAAELLVPDRTALHAHVSAQETHMGHVVGQVLSGAREALAENGGQLHRIAGQVVAAARQQLTARQQLLDAYNPHAALQRGYALVKKGQQAVKSGNDVTSGDELDILLADASVTAEVKHVTMKGEQHETG